MMMGTPESRIAVGVLSPLADCGSVTGFFTPSTYTLIARTVACHHCGPLTLDAITFAYSILLGSWTRSGGCLPIPSTDGTRSEPGRSRARPKKRDPGAVETGVMLKRLEEREAPSGASLSVGGICWAMRELAGSARPMTPLKLDDSGSLFTLTAETASGGQSQAGTSDGGRTECLVGDVVPSELHGVPDDGAIDLALGVLDLDGPASCDRGGGVVFAAADLVAE